MQAQTTKSPVKKTTTTTKPPVKTPAATKSTTPTYKGTPKSSYKTAAAEPDGSEESMPKLVQTDNSTTALPPVPPQSPSFMPIGISAAYTHIVNGDTVWVKSDDLYSSVGSAVASPAPKTAAATTKTVSPIKAAATTAPKAVSPVKKPVVATTTKPTAAAAKTTSPASKPPVAKQAKDNESSIDMQYPILPTDVKVISKSATGVFVANADLPTLSNYERDRLIKIQRLIRTSSYLDQFSGVVIVAKDFVPIYKHAGGYANLDYNIYNALESKFNTCRITECFTAVAIMQLAEQKKLALQTPIEQYLPTLKSTTIGALTPHQLLTHTTGLPNYYTNLEYVNDFFKMSQVGEMLELIASKNPTSNTTCHSNSPSDYVVLAALIEQLTNLTYREYVVKNILKPLQMNYSDLYAWNEIIENNAVGYSFTARDSMNQKRTVVKRKRSVDQNQEAFQSAEYWGAHPFGADGVYSTAEDLLKFMKNLLQYKLLSKAYTDTLFNNYSLANATTPVLMSQYGYGFQTKNVHGQKVLYQGGTLDAISTQMRHYPEDGYTIIVFSNYYTNRAEDIADKIERSIYDNEYIVPTEPIGFVFNEYIDKEGLVYVINNFDQIMLQNNIQLNQYYPLNKLGESYAQVGEYLTAMEILKLNLKRFPNEPMVLDAIADCYLQMKQYDLAIDWFKRKLEKLPNDPRAKGMISYITQIKS